jgi:hypothetical protein
MKLTDLTPEQKRIAIAEACGWKRLATPGAWISPSGRFHYPPEPTIPDYLNDLNAMHEAEKCDALRYLFDEYVAALQKVAGFKMPICATAAQRADAFLLALNLASL